MIKVQDYSMSSSFAILLPDGICRSSQCYFQKPGNKILLLFVQFLGNTLVFSFHLCHLCVDISLWCCRHLKPGRSVLCDVTMSLQ